MTIFNKIAVTFLAFSLVVVACKKKDDTPVTPVSIGGKGGKAVFVASPKHHAWYVDSCTIYIKYNSLDSPKNGFDDSARCVMTTADTIPRATFTGLKAGNYYVAGYGYDPKVVRNVFGGTPVTITTEDSFKITVPVTEGD